MKNKKLLSYLTAGMMVLMAVVGFSGTTAHAQVILSSPAVLPSVVSPVITPVWGSYVSPVWGGYVSPVFGGFDRDDFFHHGFHDRDDFMMGHHNDYD